MLKHWRITRIILSLVTLGMNLSLDVPVSYGIVDVTHTHPGFGNEADSKLLFHSEFHS